MFKFHAITRQTNPHFRREKKEKTKSNLKDSFLNLVHFVVVTRLTFMHKAAGEKMKCVKIRRGKESTTAVEMRSGNAFFAMKSHQRCPEYYFRFQKRIKFYEQY